MKFWNIVVGVAIGVAIAVAGAWVQNHLASQPFPSPSPTASQR